MATTSYSGVWRDPMGFIDWAMERVDAAFERHGVTRVPEPMAPLDPVEYAKKIGTYRKIDRSKQYEGQRYSAEALLRNDNLLFEKQRRLEQRKFYHRIGIMVASAVLARAPEIYRVLITFFR